ncbi:hypothetical protein FOPG_12610 [Fusarium oxysporum f. sp. conglutinans race 2 54008]|uniref:Uncharacterized protein n=2 Tax=Fusarium oxysporum f. sp. conglutinans TaxID=100902 RepID=F9FVM6_FUSOF|nr:hypothetical protein FOXB_10457 [Fusarium oxysporum f. sp. conglutinans Fo5176]EXL71642.1 hypothetical protein FOPG_12610 [Fusarium oxysporum f. sp. conglutinans race 2 54008]KAG6987764.1 hypothetical protein FocnCong_v003589 [Fusarium oxysporum f. sp. conglutinans]
MSGNPDVSLQTLSAADGFLAGLIYLRTAKQATTQNRATDSFTHAGRTWKYLDAIWFSLESVRNRMLELVPRLGLRGIDNTLDSFINPVLFFQAAVLSLRNTLIGQPSSSLGDVLALYCLSHVVSCQLRSRQNSAISDTQLCIDQWGNTISKHDHRQAFSKLIRALFPELANPSPVSNFFDPVADYSDLLHFIHRNGPFELQPMQDDDLVGYPLEYSDATHNMLSLPDSRITDGAPQKGCYASSGEIPRAMPQTSAPLGPHGSALVTNLTLFLGQCGDLFQILSGLWVTAKYHYSPSSALKQARPQSGDVKPCTQHMRQDESFQDPFSLGILSIVDTFIQLGYLQTPEDVQEYMILVGKVQKRKIDDECSATDTWT